MSQEEQDNQPISPFSRFRDIIPGDELSKIKVCLVGAGGIGAPAALSLAKMGVHHLEIYDPDVVGEENLGPQMYPRRTVDQFKVDALKMFLRGQADWCNVTVHKDLYTESTRTDADVIITALDSLSARKGVWKSVNMDTCKLLVDPRMGAEVLTVHSVVPKEDADWYSLTLEGEAIEAKCTAKSTFHCGMVAGAYAAREVKAWLVGERTKVEYTVDLRYLSLLGEDQDERKARHAHEAVAAAQ
jgi:hypothetical protein